MRISARSTAILLLLILTLGAGGLAFVVEPSSPVVANLIALLALTLTAITILLTLQRQPSDEVVRAAAERQLVKVMRSYCEHEASQRGLLAHDPIPISWARTERHVTPPASRSVGIEQQAQLNGTALDIAEKFLTLPMPQLVIIGEAGSGKSSLALLLANQLLSAHRDGRPIPTVVSLAGWTPANTSLDKWVAGSLVREFPELRKLSVLRDAPLHNLIAAGRVLPILEGLDELPADQISLACKAITAFAEAGNAFALSCRSDVFESAITELGRTIGQAMVIEIASVSASQAAEYLPGGQPNGERRWEPVVNRLLRRPNGALAKTLSTPLMISIARTIYSVPKSDPRDLLKLSGTRSIESHLFDRYLSTAYAFHGIQTEKQASQNRKLFLLHERGLKLIASHLESHNTTRFHWWDLASILDARTRRRWGGYLGTACFLIPAIIAVLNPASGILVPIIVVAFGFAISRRIASVERIQSQEYSKPILRVMQRAPNVSLSLVVPIACILALSTWALMKLINQGPSGWLLAFNSRHSPFPVASRDLSTIITIATVNTMILFSLWLASRLHKMSYSNESHHRFMIDYRRSWRVTVVSGLTLVAFGNIAFSIATSFQHTDPVEVTAISIFLFLGGSLPTGGASGWFQFQVFRVFFYRKRSLPWSPMKFLLGAYDRGILRLSGSALEFRHSKLQSHLASHSDGARRSN
jgi:hypothetical protein